MAEGRTVPKRTIEGTEVLKQYKEGPTEITKIRSKQIISNTIEDVDNICNKRKTKENVDKDLYID